MTKDTVRFGTHSFTLPTGYDEAGIRAALVQSHPAAAQADCVKSPQDGGGFLWTFTAKAGSKG